MINKTPSLINKLLRWIAKCSILPATIFTKMQVQAIHKEFSRFWGLEKDLPSIKKFSHFSTFTFGAPLNLWSYYFPTLAEIEKLRECYTLEPIQVQTEDGVMLCGMHFKAHETSHEARTIIVFGGNGELYKIGASAWLFKLLQDSSTPFNIVMFDHRECGFSTGVAHAQGLVLDGEAIYQYVKTELKVDENYIDLCGFSLGAAVATLVKAKHSSTQGCLISNRSFQTLDHAVKGIFSRLMNPFSQFFGLLASKLRHTSGWNLNPLEAWKTITSPKMVICHPEDPVVSHCASLEQGLAQHDLLTECLHIQLHQKNPFLNITNHHVQPLSFYDDQHGQDAEEVVLNFLCESSRK